MTSRLRLSTWVESRYFGSKTGQFECSLRIYDPSLLFPRPRIEGFGTAKLDSGGISLINAEDLVTNGLMVAPSRVRTQEFGHVGEENGDEME